jgi:hypothetical protein
LISDTPKKEYGKIKIFCGLIGISAIALVLFCSSSEGTLKNPLESQEITMLSDDQLPDVLA